MNTPVVIASGPIPKGGDADAFERALKGWETNAHLAFEQAEQIITAENNAAEIERKMNVLRAQEYVGIGSLGDEDYREAQLVVALSQNAEYTRLQEQFDAARNQIQRISLAKERAKMAAMIDSARVQFYMGRGDNPPSTDFTPGG